MKIGAFMGLGDREWGDFLAAVHNGGLTIGPHLVGRKIGGLERRWGAKGLLTSHVPSINGEPADISYRLKLSDVLKFIPAVIFDRDE